MRIQLPSVDPLVRLLIAGCAWWVEAAEGEKLPLQKVDPQTRVKLLAALAGLVILGLAMMLLAWMGARAARRYGDGIWGPRSSSLGSSPHPDDWSRKPLPSDSPGSERSTRSDQQRPEEP